MGVRARPGVQSVRLFAIGAALSEREAYVALNLLPFSAATFRRRLSECGSAQTALARVCAGSGLPFDSGGAGSPAHDPGPLDEGPVGPSGTPAPMPLGPGDAPASRERAFEGRLHGPHSSDEPAPAGFLSAGAAARLGVSGMLEQARKEIARAAQLGVRLVTLSEDAYPSLLLEIPDPPPVLYVCGRLEPDDEVRVAVVGSRRSTRYGDNAAHDLASGLGILGVTVVSGMARGIDAAAHRAALSCGARTLAVLGSGLARIYPADHEQLARRIAAQGAVLSEYPLEARPLPPFFPRRNRVISGLSCGVVVVEAGHRSGALVTARLALEQNRELYAVPGSIFSETSAGTNGLLDEGVAHIAVSPASILRQLPPPFRVRLGLPPSSHEEAPDGAPPPSSGRSVIDRTGPGRDSTRPDLGSDADLVWRHLKIDDAVSIEHLAEACGLPAPRLLVALSILEMSGLAEKLPGNRVARPRPSGRRT